jgi:hypothetical protein
VLTPPPPPLSPPKHKTTIKKRVAKRSGGKVFELPGVTHRGAFVEFDALRAAIAAAA